MTRKPHPGWNDSGRVAIPKANETASHREQIAEAERRQAKNQGETNVGRKWHTISDNEELVEKEKIIGGILNGDAEAKEVQRDRIQAKWKSVSPIVEKSSAGYGPAKEDRPCQILHDLTNRLLQEYPESNYRINAIRYISRAMDALVGLPDKEGNRRQAEKDAKEKLPRDILDGLMINLKRDYSHTIGLDSVVRNLEIARTGLPFLSKKGKMTP